MEGKPGKARLRRKAPLKQKKGLSGKAQIKRRTPLKAKTRLKARQKTAKKTGKPYYSVFTDDMGTCYVTGATERVEAHHIFGGADKALSEKYGFMLPLRSDWHRGEKYSIHMDRGFSVRMKVKCQEHYVNVLGKSRQEWQGEFRKWYTQEDMGKGDGSDKRGD